MKENVLLLYNNFTVIPSTLIRPIDHLIAQLNALKTYLSTSTIDFFLNRPTIKLVRLLNKVIFLNILIHLETR